MEPINRYSLESFAERHRADFDLHEPRPELWEALTQQLDADAAVKSSQPRMSVSADEPVPAPLVTPDVLPARQPVLRAQRRGRWQWVGVAAALAALVVAASLGERWKSQHLVVAVVGSGTARSAEPDAALYLGAGAEAVAASQGGPNGNARLDTAVHGMERYYASQLADRQTQLSQLAPEQVGEWARDLVSLDSSYQQLKRELPQHPQPDLVLTEMNRNLQTRLDILDRQLELRGDNRLALTGGNSEYALADSRSVADNLPNHHAR